MAKAAVAKVRMVAPAAEVPLTLAAVARVRAVAPAAEGPLTLARAARACRPRCCQEWAASLEATEAVEPQAAATIARQRAIRR